jgi:hypothetical protein
MSSLNINNYNFSIYNGNSVTSDTRRVILNSGRLNSSCQCPQLNNKKVLITSNNVQGETQSQRINNIVNYYLGGRTQFGNQGVYQITFLGKREGQPGGINGPLRNNF